MSTIVLVILIIVTAILAVPKPLRWTAKRIGPILLLLLCVTGLLYFLQRTSYMTVSVTANGQMNEDAAAGEIWLKEIIVDGKKYPASDLFSKGWIDEDGYLKWRTYGHKEDLPNTIDGKIPAGKEIALVFDSCKWRGIAEVQTADDRYVIDTYDPTDRARTQTVSLEFPGKANSFHADAHSILLGILIAVTVLGSGSIVWGALRRKKKGDEEQPAAIPQKSRIVWLDVLKIVSAFFIVLIHTVGGGFTEAFNTERWMPFAVLNVFPRFAVPVFMMISGVLLLGKEIELNAAIKKASKALILLVFWNIVFMLLHEALWGPSGNLLRLVLSIPVKRQFSGHLWYVYFLVWMYLFSPILSALYRALSKKQLRYLVAISIILPGILDLYQNYTGFGGADFLPSFYLYMSFSYAAMMLLGRMLYDDLDNFKRPALWGIIFTAAGFIMMLVLTLTYSAAQGKASGDLFFAENKLFAVVMGTGVFLLTASLRNAMQQFPERLRRCIGFFSQRALGIYFFHVVALWTLGSFSVGNWVVDKTSIPGAALLVCVIAYVISLYCVSLMSMIPMLKKTVM